MIPRRQRLGPKPFSFMDLPVEIRLQVAEYVLRNDAPLEWAWADEKNSKHVGKIRGVRSVNPLGLVSRQLYADTWGVFWKVNTFSFNVCHVWLLYYDGRAPFTETYAVFLRNIGMKAATLLRSIMFSIDLVVNTTSDLESFLTGSYLWQNKFQRHKFSYVTVRGTHGGIHSTPRVVSGLTS
jgi:hypothetical protein